MDKPKILIETRRFRVLEQPPITSQGKLVRRQYIDHPGAVVVVPRLDDGRVCLIRNFRFAVGRTLIEAPAGGCEPGEATAVTASRELQEETGYRAGNITELPGLFLSPGICNERMHVFVATDLTPGESAHEPGEQIENLVLPWADALEMIRSGEIEDAKTVAAILHCECFGGG